MLYRHFADVVGRTRRFPRMESPAWRAKARETSRIALESERLIERLN